MPRSKDVLVFYWIASALSLTACLMSMPRKLLWCIWMTMSAHALTRSRSLPMIAASLGPWALSHGVAAADNAFLAMAYAFFYMAYEWDLDPEPAQPAQPVEPLKPVPNPLQAVEVDVDDI